jgi:hypothetical protein
LQKSSQSDNFRHGEMLEKTEEDIHVKTEVGGVELIEAISREWRALAESTAADQPFYHPEFIAAYAKHFTPGKVVLLTAMRGEKLQAVLPLVEERVGFYGIPATRWRSPANALRFDLTIADGAEGETALRAIWKELQRQKGYDFIELREVPDAGRCEKLIAMAAAEGFPVGRWVSKNTPHIPLQQIGDKPWLNLARKSLIETLKTSTRKMMRELGGIPALRREQYFAAQSLERFYALEAAGWKGKGGTAIASKANNLLFHQEYTEAAAQHGYLCVDSLFCKDQLVAAAIAFIHRKKYFVLKWSYDENLQKYAPGHLLINAILERCVQEGYTEFDFMGEKFDYETRWTPMSREHAFLYIFRPTVKARLLERLKFGAVPLVKKWQGRLKKKN